MMSFAMIPVWLKREVGDCGIFIKRCIAYALPIVIKVSFQTGRGQPNVHLPRSYKFGISRQTMPGQPFEAAGPADLPISTNPTIEMLEGERHKLDVRKRVGVVNMNCL